MKRCTTGGSPPGTGCCRPDGHDGDHCVHLARMLTAQPGRLVLSTSALTGTVIACPGQGIQPTERAR